MDAKLEEILIYTAGAAAAIPLGGATVLTIGAIYSTTKGIGQKILYNPEKLTLKELYQKNWTQFFKPRQYE